MVATIAVSCDWPLENPRDPRLCDPRCTSGTTCLKGVCVGTDAGRDRGAVPDRPADLPSSPSDLSGPDSRADLSRPADSGCTANAAQCDGADKLRFCESGGWKTDTCENLCKAGGYDYSAGCEYSPSKGKEVCTCGKWVVFGGLCDNKLKCDPSLFCGVFGAATKGFCTKYCANPGGQCTGAPSGTSATCTLLVSGKNVCGFDCSGSNCPTDLKCDVPSGQCKP